MSAQRAAIWRGIFPPRTPTHPLRLERLAQLDVSGGHIRNIALTPSFLAATGESRCGWRTCRAPLERSTPKLERTLTDTELRGWAQ